MSTTNYFEWSNRWFFQCFLINSSKLSENIFNTISFKRDVVLDLFKYVRISTNCKHSKNPVEVLFSFWNSFDTETIHIVLCISITLIGGWVAWASFSWYPPFNFLKFVLSISINDIYKKRLKFHRLFLNYVVPMLWSRH